NSHNDCNFSDKPEKYLLSQKCIWTSYLLSVNNNLLHFQWQKHHLHHIVTFVPFCNADWCWFRGHRLPEKVCARKSFRGLSSVKFSFLLAGLFLQSASDR